MEIAILPHSLTSCRQRLTCMLTLLCPAAVGQIRVGLGQMRMGLQHPKGSVGLVVHQNHPETLKNKVSGNRHRGWFGLVTLLLFLSSPGDSHMWVGFLTTKLRYDPLYIWPPFKESSPFQRHQTSLLSDGSGCFLYPNFCSVGLLQGPWFSMGEISMALALVRGETEHQP